MQIKRYEAVSAREAMEKIKTDLGPDAVVLSTKKVRGKIEVVAARDHLGLEVGEGGLTGGSDMVDLFKTELDQVKTLIRDSFRERELQAELTELKETVGMLLEMLGIQRKKDMPSHLSKVYYHLLSVGISKKRALSLIEEVKGSSSPDILKDYYRTMGAVEGVIQRSLAPAYQKPKKRQRLCAFVGPAGEGKTTTLAKLAARSLAGEDRRLGVITMDTYRIGGTQQLKIYTDIMDVPMAVASGKQEFDAALKKFSDRDIILIDTPGKSRSNEKDIMRLKEYCITDLPLETNLVLSTTSSPENTVDAVKGFGNVDYDNIIFTKLDDSRRCGSIYNVVDAVGKPVWYVANGQNVPRDLRDMDSARLARLIVENRL